jgi:hypothetical protein
MHLLALLVALLLLPVAPPVPQPLSSQGFAPVLQNPGFECGEGYHDEPGIHGMVANGWTGKLLRGDPFMASTQMWASTGTRCDPNDMRWEKLEGYDSNIFLASYAPVDADFVAPPFDVALYQPLRVEPKVEYSLSAWMVSLCGGSASPNDCPAGAYISKMAGLDPTGGTDPLAGTVQWTEDRRPHTEARWTNLVLSSTAVTSTMTVFLRLDSPFWHHANSAFADAVKIVRAPTSRFEKVSARGNDIAMSWTGSLGPDIPAIPATNHKLSFELQVRRGNGAWEPWLSGQGTGGATFTVARFCRDVAYRFRIRSWAVQPDGVPGAWPNHHFAGVWHESEPLQVAAAIPCSGAAYLPLLAR